mmetsp:Transcript_21361/g.40027  ORF Transcript_21361/g.40027 Transcript_21361/m.40027 type:complete len:355 (+) Transcript_21361:276-1340(+)
MITPPHLAPFVPPLLSVLFFYLLLPLIFFFFNFFLLFFAKFPGMMRADCEDRFDVRYDVPIKNNETSSSCWVVLHSIRERRAGRNQKSASTLLHGISLCQAFSAQPSVFIEHAPGPLHDDLVRVIQKHRPQLAELLVPGGLLAGVVRLHVAQDRTGDRDAVLVLGRPSKTHILACPGEVQSGLGRAEVIEALGAAKPPAAAAEGRVAEPVRAAKVSASESRAAAVAETRAVAKARVKIGLATPATVAPATAVVAAVAPAAVVAAAAPAVAAPAAAVVAETARCVAETAIVAEAVAAEPGTAKARGAPGEITGLAKAALLVPESKLAPGVVVGAGEPRRGHRGLRGAFETPHLRQ